MTETIARLKRTNGEVLAAIPLPRSAAEISLARYVSFLNELKKFQLEGANPMLIMSQAVSEVSGVDIAEILQAKVGEQWVADKELDGGVRSFYGWFTRALTNYRGEARTPGDFEFEYKGETYQIPYIVQAELVGGLPTLPGIETGEAVEAYETYRGFQQQIKDAGDPTKERGKRIKMLKEAIAKGEDATGDMAREINRLQAEIELTGDPNGNLTFAQYLRLIAILAKKPGERLPTNDGDRERWIQSRMIHLQEIDAKTALDVDFFLTRLFWHCETTHHVIGSLTAPLFALSATIQSRQQQKGKRIIAQYRGKRTYKNGLAGVR